MNKKRCCCPICATSEAVRRLRFATELVAAASEAWCDHGEEDEMALSFLHDEVQTVLSMRPWKVLAARRRLREAMATIDRNPLNNWTTAVPMLAEQPYVIGIKTPAKEVA